MNAILNRYRWDVPSRRPDVEGLLVKSLNISPLLASILVARGYKEPEAAEKFLNPRLEDLPETKDIPDYEKAVREILGAIERQELIFVHGDYDVDGLTSAALFTRFLRRLGARVYPHVPNRFREGHGVHMDAVERAAEMGARLFLTCDCGIRAHDQVEAALRKGMRVVVTDHHQLGDDLPRAHAVVNLHRSDSGYGFKFLSGCGVVFRLCEGITRERGIDVANFRRAFLDLAVLGTVADVMPLTNDNRILTKFGLEQLAETRKPGLRALISETGVKPPLTAQTVAFVLAPPLNAVGRLDESSIGLDLLLEDDEERAKEIARQLAEWNKRRQEIQAKTLEEALQRIEGRDLDRDPAVVVWSPTWHRGVVGIVAGKVREAVWRPAFVIAIEEDGIAHGSARSIPGFDVGAAVSEAASERGLLLSGGGHESAAGFSLRSDRLEEFEAFLQERARRLDKDCLVPKIWCDAEVDAEELSPQALRELESLAPFGTGNPKPTFVVRDVEVLYTLETRNPDHSKLYFRGRRGRELQAMGFELGPQLDRLAPGNRLDVVLEVDFENGKGNSGVKLVLKDLVALPRA